VSRDTARVATDDALTVWAGRPVESLCAEWGVPALHAFRSTTSTNDVARRLADAGAAHGTTVVADHQTAGRGRQGRGWADAPGASLLLSMVLRPAEAPEPPATPSTPVQPAVLPLLVGLACARAIRDATGVAVGIEWPNDVVAGDRKLGGILCEAALRSGAIDFVVAGIGINVDALPRELEPAERAEATSLADLVAATARSLPPRHVFAGAVAARLCALRADSAFSSDDLDELRRSDALSGRRVRLGTGREGVALRILADGSLEIEDGTGRFAVHSGSVSPIGPRGH
jgi:BirA family biotin operon repressor/biotin-[acetyl-CoA-carboxylase] ligase